MIYLILLSVMITYVKCEKQLNSNCLCLGYKYTCAQKCVSVVHILLQKQLCVVALSIL